MLSSSQIFCVSSASTPIGLDLAAPLKQARDSADLRQKELADLFGVSLRALQDWEKGNGTPLPQHRRLIKEFIADPLLFIATRQEAA